MRKYFKVLLTLLAFVSTLVFECPICNHLCDEYCIVDEDNICQHDCDYPIDPLDKWDPWG